MAYICTFPVHTGCMGSVHAFRAREGNENELAKTEPATIRAFRKGTPSEFGVDEKACGIAEDAIINVCVLYNRMCVVPVAVENKGNPEDDRGDEDGSKHGRQRG